MCITGSSPPLAELRIWNILMQIRIRIFAEMVIRIRIFTEMLIQIRIRIFTALVMPIRIRIFTEMVMQIRIRIFTEIVIQFQILEKIIVIKCSRNQHMWQFRHFLKIIFSFLPDPDPDSIRNVFRSVFGFSTHD